MKIFEYINFKIICDKIFSSLLLFFIWPIMLIIYFLISIDLGKPIFFIQKRTGYNQKPFILLKFRTMNNKKNFNSKLLSDKERITKLGNFLRKTSLDELPTLLNVLKGDMSFVGPRPLLPEYLSLYNNKQLLRNKAIPGITGLSQISGRNKLGWEKKLSLDVKYVEKISFLLDLKILFITFFKVLKRSDITFEEKFMGN